MLYFEEDEKRQQQNWLSHVHFSLSPFHNNSCTIKNTIFFLLLFVIRNDNSVIDNWY